MRNLRELLTNVNATPEISLDQELETMLKETLSALTAPNISSPYREDLRAILLSAITATRLLSNKNYNIDELLEALSLLQSRVSFILLHSARARPRTSGYGIMNEVSGKMLPLIKMHESEARDYLESLRALNADTSQLRIIPIELSSPQLPRPSGPQAPQPAPSPLPPPVPSPAVAPSAVTPQAATPLPSSPGSILITPPKDTP